MNKIEETLGLAEFEDEEKTAVMRVQTPVPIREKNSKKPTKQDIIDDYNYSRKTLTTVIDAGMEALNGALNSAAESGHPRAYEVASSIMSQLSNAAKDLLALSETAKKLSDIDEGDSQKPGFVGSTKELSKLLKETDEKK